MERPKENMITRIHKIHWPAQHTSSGKDIEIEVTDVNAFVTKVTHPCANWAIDEAWYRVCHWFQNKGAIITLGEPEEK